MQQRSTVSRRLTVWYRRRRVRLWSAMDLVWNLVLNFFVRNRLYSQMFIRHNRISNLLYQIEDAGFIDYQLTSRFGIHLRGPAWQESEPVDLNIVGSARVFGRYWPQSFPELLTEVHRVSARNIGFSGCTPRRIIENSALMQYLQQSPAIPVIQVCGGGAATCDWFETSAAREVRLAIDWMIPESKRSLAVVLGRRENLEIYAEAVGLTATEVSRRIQDNQDIPLAFPKGLCAGADVFLAAATRTQPVEVCLHQVKMCQDWIYLEYAKLAQALGGRAVLLYFAAKPLSETTAANLARMLTVYPQLFDSKLFSRVSSAFSDQIVVVTNSGMPFRLPGSGPKVSATSRYPSKAMHRDCATAIAKWYSERNTPKVV